MLKKLFKHQNVRCPISVVKEILESSFSIRQVENIKFIYKNNEYNIGIDGEYNKTKKLKESWLLDPKTISFFFNNNTFNSLDELYNNVTIDDIPLKDCDFDVIVTECSYQYPRSVIILDKYFNEYTQDEIKW